MLEIIDLHVEAGGKEILKGINLKVEEGETCVLFGPNGSGKSTLLAAIMGYGHCTVTKERSFSRARTSPAWASMNAPDSA